jgi:hypothetical protein
MGKRLWNFLGHMFQIKTIGDLLGWWTTDAWQKALSWGVAVIVTAASRYLHAPLWLLPFICLLSAVAVIWILLKIKTTTTGMRQPTHRANSPVISLAYLPNTKPSFRFINEGGVVAFAITAESETCSQHEPKLVFPMVDRLAPHEQMDVVCDLLSWRDDLKDYLPTALARTDFAFAVNAILEWFDDIKADLIISVRHKDRSGVAHTSRWKLALNKYHEPSLLPL